jgi:hypothetical protein
MIPLRDILCIYDVTRHYYDFVSHVNSKIKYSLDRDLEWNIMGLTVSEQPISKWDVLYALI